MKKLLPGILLLHVFALSAYKVLAFQPQDPLLFRKDNYTVETRKVRTSAGEKTVVCHSWMHVQYVGRPIDKDYQSMNIIVPVSIDGAEVDASGSPILFVIGVGGYMSVNNARQASQGPQGGGMGGPGGPSGSGISGKTDLALAAGYVVVLPGCRGRDNKMPDGSWYGKAPAAIIDLKAAVRYLRHNKGVVPGNPDRIFSTGVSAGGALSALLGSSGNSRLYDRWLKDIGAADEPDNIFASACFCPITDLEHADGAYEWMYGSTPGRSGLVDQELSKQLKSVYSAYQASLKLQGRDGFGTITAENYDRYLLKYYVVPSANKYLNGLDEKTRSEYLAGNKWIKWTGKEAEFTFAGYVTHVGRMKGLPAFDDFEMKQPEPALFGNESTPARHFTEFSLRHSPGNSDATLSDEVKITVNLMNAMYFIGLDEKGCAQNWWIRHGTSDNHTSQTVICNLATSLENRNKNVNTWLYWDAGHGADQDAEEFIAWMGKLSGFRTD